MNEATGAPTYLYTDQLGSVTMEADSNGNVIGTQSYSPYGSLASSSGTDPTPFGFAGGYTDATGLIYLINRYYDPATGQFVSVDPLVQQTQEPYSYAGGDPINGNDPNGESSGWQPQADCRDNGTKIVCIGFEFGVGPSCGWSITCTLTHPLTIFGPTMGNWIVKKTFEKLL